MMNYTVVEASGVLATHITEVVKTHASELVTREEVAALLKQLKEKAPALVEEVIPTQVKPGELQKVLHNLLRERVPDPRSGNDPRNLRRMGLQDQGP